MSLDSANVESWQKTLLDNRRFAAAAQEFRSALDLWSGTPLADVPWGSVLSVVKGRQTKVSMAAPACYRATAGGTAPARLIWRTKPGWYHDRALIDLLDQAPTTRSARSVTSPSAVV